MLLIKNAYLKKKFCRMPDDKSDAVTHRNGRFINNVFVPNDAPLPDEVTIAHRMPKSVNFNFDDFYQGRRPLLPDNMAMESRSDHGVYVEPPEEFKVNVDIVNVMQVPN